MVRPHRPSQEPFRAVSLLQALYLGGTRRHALELARRLNLSRFQTEIWLMMSGLKGGLKLPKPYFLA